MLTHVLVLSLVLSRITGATAGACAVSDNGVAAAKITAKCECPADFSTRTINAVQGGWDVVANIVPITVGAGSKIKFEWTTTPEVRNHDVWKMADLDHYTRCDFTGASPQGSAEATNAGLVTLTMPTPANAEAVQYYACFLGADNAHCKSGQKITVTIIKDSDNCGVDKYCYKVRTDAGDNGDGIDPGYAPEATCVDTPKTKSCELSTDDGGNKLLTDACMCCKDKECWHPASGFVGDNCGGSLGKGNICKKKKGTPSRKCYTAQAKCKSIANPTGLCTTADGVDRTSKLPTKDDCEKETGTTWTPAVPFCADDGSKIYNPGNEDDFCAGASCSRSVSADMTTCCQDALKCSSVPDDMSKMILCGDKTRQKKYQYDELKTDNYCKAKPCGSGADETIDRSTCCKEMKQTCSQMAVDEVCGSDKEANTEAKDKECAGGKIVEGDFRNFAAECSKADTALCCKTKVATGKCSDVNPFTPKDSLGAKGKSFCGANFTYKFTYVSKSPCTYLCSDAEKERGKTTDCRQGKKICGSWLDGQLDADTVKCAADPCSKDNADDVKKCCKAYIASCKDIVSPQAGGVRAAGSFCGKDNDRRDLFKFAWSNTAQKYLLNKSDVKSTDADTVKCAADPCSKDNKDDVKKCCKDKPPTPDPGSDNTKTNTCSGSETQFTPAKNGVAETCCISCKDLEETCAAYVTAVSKGGCASKCTFTPTQLALDQVKKKCTAAQIKTVSDDYAARIASAPAPEALESGSTGLNVGITTVMYAYGFVAMVTVLSIC